MNSVYLAMLAFSFSMSISPGPVNVMIVSSAAQHGIAKTLALVSGATIGFTLLLIVVALGLGETLQAYPHLMTVMTWAGALFIVYVGVSMIRAAATASLGKGNQNLALPKFSQGFVMQWLNPKAWIACAAGTSMFASAAVVQPLPNFIVICFVVCYASLALWAVLGDRLSRWLTHPKVMCAFYWVMGGLLVLTAVSMLWQHHSAFLTSVL